MSRVTHFEIIDADTAGLKAFYESAFGWKIQAWDGPFEYWLASTGDQSAPGIDGAIAPPGTVDDQKVVITIDVDDIEATIASVLAAGGTLVDGKRAVPGIGWSAVCKDPAGITFGLMQEDSEAS